MKFAALITGRASPRANRVGIGLAAAAVVLLAIVAVTAASWPGAYAEESVTISKKFKVQEKIFPNETERALAIYRRVPAEAIAVTCLWFGMLAAAAGLLVMARLRAWWVEWPARAAPRPALATPPAASSRRNAVFAAVLVASLVTGLIVRLPRLDLSLYNDEAFTYRHFVAGEFKVAPLGEEPEFQRSEWVETIFDNRHGNNGVLYSILARLSHKAHAAFTHTPIGAVHEPSFRFPALLAGLASIAVIAVLTRRLAGSVCGALAAAIAALHPFHIRFSTEGRTHSLTLLLVPIAIWLLVKATRDGRWRWWIAFGAAEILVMISFVGAAYVLAVLAVTLAAILAWRGFGRQRSVDAQRALVRFFATQALAAIAFIAVMTPWIVQMAVALRHVSGLRGDMDMEWLRTVFGKFVFGIPIDAPDRHGGDEVSLQSLLAAHSFAAIAIIVWTVVLLALWTRGIVRLWPRGDAVRAVIIANVLGILLAVSVSAATGSYFFEWYTIIALPFFLVKVAAGADFERRIPRIAVPVAVAVLAADAFAPGIAGYARLPKEHISDAVVAMRGEVYPFTKSDPSDVITAGMFTDARIYDPYLVPLHSLDDLRALADEAKSSGRPLFVNVSRHPLALALAPEILAVLENPEAFDLVAALPGMREQQFNHYVFRWKGTRF